METVAFLGLLGLGYMANSKLSGGDSKEGFADTPSEPVLDKTPAGKPTVPGYPRQPKQGYDTMFELPAGGSLPSEPNPSNVRGGPLRYSAGPVSLPTQNNMTDAAANLQLRPDGWEDATPRGGFVSPLTGIEFKSGEFKHSNMVPFFRGTLKQSMVDTANTSLLDDYTGSGKLTYAKREQAPLFEPTKEPMGNVYGLESTTNFMETRMVESRNRANERPVESIRVGRGLNQGYTHLPSGGFQQQAGDEYILKRMPTTDDLRVANKPKVTYDAPVVTGSHFVSANDNSDHIGEVRKYNPDTFYINENGERNFVTVGADVKPTVRSAQVVKDTSRMTTTREYSGVAGQAEGKATYTIGSTRTPHVQQMGSYGYRNANLTDTFNNNTDADQNDYGKAGVEIRPNERFYTGERVHATNLAPDAGEGTLHLQDAARQTRAEELIQNPRSAGNFTALGGGAMAEKPTVYDPNDTMRTTIKETTIDNDWIGMAAPVEAQPRLTVYDPNDVARTTVRETTEDNDYVGIFAPNAAQKLTVYDPDDVARVTGRNTLAEQDTYRNLGRQDLPGNATIRVQDKVRLTQKGAISAKSSYTGIAQASEAIAQTDRTDAKAMRHYAQKEKIAQGRTPMGSSTKVFNGEDNINLQYRKLVSDSVNDRAPALDRVGTGEPTSIDVIGSQRPRNVLKLDVASTRMEPLMVASLENNPYVIPLNKPARR